MSYIEVRWVAATGAWKAGSWGTIPAESDTTFVVAMSAGFVTIGLTHSVAETLVAEDDTAKTVGDLLDKINIIRIRIIHNSEIQNQKFVKPYLYLSWNWLTAADLTLSSVGAPGKTAALVSCWYGELENVWVIYPVDCDDWTFDCRRMDDLKSNCQFKKCFEWTNCVIYIDI